MEEETTGQKWRPALLHRAAVKDAKRNGKNTVRLSVDNILPALSISNTSIPLEQTQDNGDVNAVYWATASERKVITDRSNCCDGRNRQYTVCTVLCTLQDT